ncbi:response regulator transcription factor [Nocardia gipuzkoensis]
MRLLRAGNEGSLLGYPRDEVRERAEETTRLLRELVPCSAYLLSAWDPLTGEHVHRELASEGFSKRVIEHINDGFVRDNPAFPLLHKGTSGALRWRDMARDWNLDFSRTITAEEFLIPEGFHEGTTFCLWLPDGRYTGSLHMGWSKPSEATDERRETLERFRGLLALVCDTLRTPQTLVDTLAPGAGAVVVSSHGLVAEVPGHQTGPKLAEDSALLQLLTRLGGSWQRRSFLWPKRSGSCWRITVVPCPGGVALVTAEAGPWPYGLTPRELEVLHLLTRGLSNPQIAQRLYVTVRTVATHVEHILAKLACSTRSQLVAMAVGQGLLLGEEP